MEVIISVPLFIALVSVVIYSISVALRARKLAKKRFIVLIETLRSNADAASDMSRALTHSVNSTLHSLHSANVIARASDYSSRPMVESRLNMLTRGSLSEPPPDVYEINFLIRSITLTQRVVSFAWAPTVCSIAVGSEYQKQTAGCIQSHEKYARSRGYNYVTVDTAPLHFERPAPWLKVLLILKLLKEREANIFYIDADALITNEHYDTRADFNSLEQKGASLLLTEDEAGLNSGVMFIRNCLKAQALFELLWMYDADVHNGTWEQAALKSIVNQFPQVRSEILIEADAKKFNSFPVERNLFHGTHIRQVWTKGDFVCHFSGIRMPHLEAFITRYVNALAIAAETRVATDHQA